MREGGVVVEMRGEETAAEKYAALLDRLRGLGSVCIGYSGGVDSVFLARAAVEALGSERVLAVTGLSPSYPEVQRSVARTCAERIGVRHLEIDTDELADPNYAANPRNRCYFCKTELWGKLRRVADEHGLEAVLDGSNADDAGDFRPGAIAAREHGVLSPLQDARLTKGEIRALSHGLDLPTWDQPAAPCLASRLPYGLAVTPARLRAIERAEEGVRALGIVEFRVRHHGDLARLEVSTRELDSALNRASALARTVRAAGFDRVLLDIEGYRRGALNEAPALVPLTMDRT